MTNELIEIRLEELVHEERRITSEILQLINIAEDRKLYVDHGFSSMFNWLTKRFKYSEPAANRRINAARALRSLPDGAEKIEDGVVNLTTLSKAQSAIRQQEKQSGTKLTDEQKTEAVQTVENKSCAQTEQALATLLPQSALPHEKVTPISADASRFVADMPNEIREDLERARELLSHVNPEGMSLMDVIGFLAKDFRKRKDPLLKPAKTEKAAGQPEADTELTQRLAAAAKQRVSIPAHVRREVMKRDKAQCTFIDERTGRVCGSRHKVQLDHIYPKALGGEDTPKNLRCLCRTHNLHMAEVLMAVRPDMFT